MFNLSTKPLLSLDASQIIESAKVVGYERFCGVYFLVDDGEVVYVGQSKDIAFRLVSHRAGRKFKFSTVAWIAVPEPYLDMVESWYFHKLKPRHSKTTPFRDVEFLRKRIFASKAACFLNSNAPILSTNPQHVDQLISAEINPTGL